MWRLVFRNSLIADHFPPECLEPSVPSCSRDALLCPETALAGPHCPLSGLTCLSEAAKALLEEDPGIKNKSATKGERYEHRCFLLTGTHSESLAVSAGHKGTS